jgi:hypothetical protein
VGDEQDRHPDLALQKLDQVEDLGLDRDVERGRRLVGDQERRAAGERHRDHRALAHAARELVRVLIELALGLGQADQLQHLERLGPRLAFAFVLVEDDRLGDLAADAGDRVERGHRLLEDHRDVVAADPAQRLRPLTDEVDAGAGAAAKADGARDDPAAGHVGEAKERHRRDRLARAALADQRHGLAARDVPGDAVDRADHAVLDRELDAQVLDLDQAALRKLDGRCALERAGGRHRAQMLPVLRRSRGSSVSRRPSPKRFTPRTTRVRKMPGKSRIQIATMT